MISGLFALVAAGASACVADTVDPNPLLKSTEVEDAPINSAGTYRWRSGNTPVEMGSASEKSCFLSAIEGDYESDEEWVHADVSEGRWYLSGSNEEGSSRAAATCVSTTAGLTEEITWTQGQGNVYLGPVTTPDGTERACFLTRVGGDFDGSSESVAITETDGAFWLGGSSRSTGVHARARCIDVTARISRWTGKDELGVTGKDMPTAIPMTEHSEPYTHCLLTGIKGELSGDDVADQYIRIWPNVETQELILHVWTTRSQIEGSAICFR
ncbi:hypothetical protein [Sorangium sp. So ce131]|uniref:hypothetical protein n=1 Tax=Sorangium sp. So ce131 TaxID=3133282 RepID=UPI003F62C240